MRTKIAFFICFMLQSVVFAATQTIVCEQPQGTRIDYFSKNNLNLQNQTFMMARDRVSGMEPQIILDSEKKDINFVIGDAKEAKAVLKKGDMQVLIFNDDQISFAGVINGAPILATYYPKEAALVYSQQSIWPGPNYGGIRAVIFYARCKVK